MDMQIMTRYKLALMMSLFTSHANALQLSENAIAVQKDLYQLGIKKNVAEVYERHIDELGNNSLDKQSKTLVNQFIATYFSFIGLHKHAENAYQYSLPNPPSLNLSDFTVRNAVSEIRTLSKKSRLVMINEAHHVTKHRWLTKALLADLKKEGFSYLAVEALSQKDEQRINKQGYATLNSGIYIREPSFAGFLSAAKELGYTLVSYDNHGKNRESEGAENIIKKTFAVNAQAKVVVHCGYNHINEKDKLASILANRLKIDPITVDQTSLMSANLSGVEASSPVVFKSDTGQYWQPQNRYVDMAVYWPDDDVGEGRRPPWFMAGYKQIRLEKAWCKEQFPCYIEVRNNVPDAISFDSFLWLTPMQTAFVRARSGDSILIYGREGNLINKIKI